MKNRKNDNQNNIEESFNLVKYYNNIGETQMNYEENKQNPKERKVCSLKGAFGEEEQTQSNNRLAQIDNRSALQYWQDELVNKAEGTRVNYLRYFKDFLKFVNMTADEVFTSRKTSALNKSRN